jgi:uncharacterized membrane protein YhaH (DUF805 family)
MQFTDEPTRTIGFGAALIRVLRLTFRKRGRAPRREFWFYFLAYVALFVGIGLAEGVVDQEWLITLCTVVYLAGLVPLVSVGIRRLHDVGHNGWWCLLLISCIGWLVLIIFWSGQGQPEENRFGPPPR